MHDRRATEKLFNGRIAVDEIDDPYGIREFAVEMRAEHVHDRNTPANPSATELRSAGQPKVQIIRSLRDDPLAAMYAAGQITKVQRDAGRAWEGWFHHSEIGPIRAIDPSRDKVDGGKLAEPLGNRALYAQDKLRECRDWLGEEGNDLVNDVLGWARLSLRHAAERRGKRSESDRKYIGRRFRECLDTIAEVAGLSSRTAAPQDVVVLNYPNIPY